MTNEKSFMGRVADKPRLAYRYARYQTKNLMSSLRSSGPGRQFSQGVGETFGMHYEKGVSQGFLGRKMGLMKGGVGGFLGRAAFPAFTAYGMYQGYQEGGVVGAAKSGAEAALGWGVMRAGFSMLSNPFVLGAAAIGAAGYGTYRFGLAAKERASKMRNLEMGADVVDMFGTLGTMRQRSISAINNSRINGRTALGNEALILTAAYKR